MDDLVKMGLAQMGLAQKDNVRRTFAGQAVDKDQADKIRTQLLLGQYGLATPSQAYGGVMDTLYNQPEEPDKVFELAGMYSSLAQAASAAGDPALARQYLEQANQLLSSTQLAHLAGVGQPDVPEEGRRIPVDPSEIAKYSSFADIAALGQEIPGLDTDKYLGMERTKKKMGYKAKPWEIALGSMFPLYGLYASGRTGYGLATGEYDPLERVPNRMSDAYSPEDIERFNQYTGLFGGRMPQQ